MRTARLYADLGLFTTCNPEIARDVVHLFHYLTGRSELPAYASLLVASVTMRTRFLELIGREVEKCKAGRPARIVAKMNQLEDSDVIRALLEASRAGVPIDVQVVGMVSSKILNLLLSERTCHSTPRLVEAARFSSGNVSLLSP